MISLPPVQDDTPLQDEAQKEGEPEQVHDMWPPEPTEHARENDASAEHAPAQEPQPEPWAREDTREFEPILPSQFEEALEPQYDRDGREPAKAVLHRIPGAESRDFDWGE
ncbi:MAG TPA: hypothetical protein VGM80_04800 [Gaiellaceae bacterium]